MQILIKGYSTEQSVLILEIIKYGNIIDQSIHSLYKFVITNRIYRYKGNVYLFVLINNRLVTFEELNEV